MSETTKTIRAKRVFTTQPVPVYEVKIGDEYHDDLGLLCVAVPKAGTRIGWTWEYLREPTRKPKPKPTEENILTLADGYTAVERQGDYGSPYDHHSKTAAVASEYFSHKLKEGVSFTARDIERFYVLDKLIRDLTKPKIDNEADVAGYARTMQMSRLEAILRKDDGYFE